MSLNSAFSELRRKHKLMARQNFKCCQGCGLSAMSNDVKDLPKDKRPKGFAFFHKQEAEHLKKYGKVHVAFGAFEHTAVPAKAFGQLARDVFVAHGCPVDWNESPDMCLIVWRDANAKREYVTRRLGRAA